MANPRPARVGLRLDHLWVIFALSVIGGFISLAPTAPNDFWWHLKVGELVATGGIPTTNLFAWTLPADHPYTYQSWLGEWLFYALFRVGGLPMTIFARNALGTAAFGLVAWEARLRSGSWRLGALAALLAAAMTINNLNARTQNWSWLPFMATLMILGGYAAGRLRARWLIALPAIMIFWVNAHGAFVMGLLVAGAFVVGETLRRLLRQPRALVWPQLRRLYLTSAGMLAATVVNPLGFGVFGYVASLLGDDSSQGLINEWQPPNPHSIAGAMFVIGVLALIAAFALARRRPSITDVLIVCGLAWQAFLGARYVVWFGVAAMPIVAQSLAAPRAVFSTEGAPAPRRPAGSPANLLPALLLAAMVVALQPWLKPLLPLPEPYRAIFAEVPGAPQLFSADTPVAAVEELRARPCAGPIFNEMGYGSYMAWALYPAAQSFIDPRVELFPSELWDDYVAISRGDGSLAGLDRHGVACVLLDTGHQAGLVAALEGSPAWARSFQAGRSEIWRRR
ncbi:hypothetical protein K2Z83_21865 [Oscillochloris sp. ZM17-4]|uniref:hypothetical protein n=1 Tax=Oscillochloris sp. ZM17-4 TaxID=2866714 RepID=UPI001C72A386|nr:hypothetical protein [Oscillochloris sp. ZM17-4]MBX0330315.1 hypothetical protein [Oscillochloris sp. ZM17-4]